MTEEKKEQKGVSGTGKGSGGAAWSLFRRTARGVHWSARGRRGPWAMIGVWLIAAMFVLVVGAFWMGNRTPRWFAPVVVDGAMRETARRLENRLITEAYRYRGVPRDGEKGTARRTGEAWTVRITQGEATAWLSVKLPEWLLNLEPPARLGTSVTDLQGHFQGGSVIVAARMEGAVVSVWARPTVSSTGVWLSGVRAGIGSLAVPAWLGGLAIVKGESAFGDEGAWRVVSGRAPVLKDAVLRLEDGRRVRVIEVRVGDEVLEVECVTEVP